MKTSEIEIEITFVTFHDFIKDLIYSLFIIILIIYQFIIL